eukprot:EG_transcript_1873
MAVAGVPPPAADVPFKARPFQRPASATFNNRFIVKWKAATDLADHAALPARLRSAASRSRVHVVELHHDAHARHSVVRLPGYTAATPAAARAALLRALGSDPAVEYVEEDRRVFAARVPNDPLFSLQWHYGGVGPGVYRSGLTYGMNLPDAWNGTVGDAVVVAVLDTGITSHPDLNAKVLPGYDMVSADSPGDFSTANDGDGRDPDPSDPGDWTDDEDSSWHGTHVSGTIAALTNNSVGVAGVSWGAKLLPVRVIGSGGGYSSDINAGLRWAVGLSVAGVPTNPTNAKVINLSLGGDGYCSRSQQDAITAAVAAGAVVVVAAGNENEDTNYKTPCSCNQVICVGAHGPSGQRAVYSNYGTEVDVMAPGGDTALGRSAYAVVSTWNNGTKGPGSPVYAGMEGTSMATPHVTGLVALMLSVNRTLSFEQVEAALRLSARPFPAPNTAPRYCNTARCGAGLADARAAVDFVRSLPPNDLCPAAIPLACGSVVTGSTLNATATAADPECGATKETTGDVWYSLPLKSVTAIRLSTCDAGTTFNTQIGVYAGSCSALRCVGGQANTGCGAGTDLVLFLQSGTRLIRVSGRDGARGWFRLEVTCGAFTLPSPAPSPSPSPSPSVPPPAGACHATSVTCNSVVSGNTLRTPVSSGQLTCQGVSHTSPDQWFSLALPARRAVTVSTVGGAYWDTKLSVYDGACGALRCVAANDDTLLSISSQVTVQAQGQLFIMVHGYKNAAGPFKLTVHCN